ncbi:unnamed protein product, partial [Staurois parvus]
MAAAAALVNPKQPVLPHSPALGQHRAERGLGSLVSSPGRWPKTARRIKGEKDSARESRQYAPMEVDGGHSSDEASGPDGHMKQELHSSYDEERCEYHVSKAARTAAKSMDSSVQREGCCIWKMHMLKGADGLGIQITGGRGSKRSPHGIVVAHVEEGGSADRY